MRRRPANCASHPVQPGHNQRDPTTPLNKARRWIQAKRVERLEENIGASQVELTDAQLADLRAAADQVQILGARYPEAQDRMTNQEAPLPTR